MFSRKRIVLLSIMAAAFISAFMALQFIPGSGSARCEEPDGAVFDDLKQIDKSSYAYTRRVGREAVIAQAGGGPDTEDAVIN